MSLTWTYGGTALTSFGKITVIDGYLDMPQRRGTNQIIPFQHGTMHAGKYYDQRTLAFGITITAASASALETTFDNLRKLIAPHFKQLANVVGLSNLILKYSGIQADNYIRLFCHVPR